MLREMITVAKNQKSEKSLIVFDLDGTLAESKTTIDAEMANLLARLLGQKKVAVIGGGGYEQFQKQFLKGLKGSKQYWHNLFLFPTTATSFYIFGKASSSVKTNTWHPVYEHTLKTTDKKKIFTAFEKAFKETKYQHPKKHFGPFIEDRQTQISFSALGQKAPVEKKMEWNKNDVRPRIMKAMKKYLPEFEIRSGGLTTIDITPKGIDKAYGIRQIEKHLKIAKKNMLFVGDRIFAGGNDYAIVKTGVEYKKVENPEDTKRVIKELLD